METLLIIAMALTIGLLSTRVMKLLSLPDVTGYLIMGFIIGPFALGLIDADGVKSLQFITTLALGFIAFSIGSSFKIDFMKKVGKSVTVITVVQALGAVILVDIVLIIVGCPLPLSLVLGAIATATAPTSTLMVIKQYKAKGALTDTLLPVVAFDDAIGLMVFAMSLAIAEVLHSGAALTATSIVLEPVLEILLSLGIGTAIGLVLAYGSRLFKSQSNRYTLIIAATLAGLALSDMLALSDLLVCMMIGAVYTNLYHDTEKPLLVTDRWSYPVNMLFFILSGAELNVALIPTIGLWGIIYIVCRALGKYYGAYFGGKMVHADDNVTKYLGWTLLPQAGVAIGMVTMAANALPEFGSKISTIVLCATIVYELVGPVITKFSLIKAGEIDMEQFNKEKTKVKKA